MLWRINFIRIRLTTSPFKLSESCTKSHCYKTTNNFELLVLKRSSLTGGFYNICKRQWPSVIYEAFSDKMGTAISMSKLRTRPGSPGRKYISIPHLRHLYQYSSEYVAHISSQQCIFLKDIWCKHPRDLHTYIRPLQVYPYKRILHAYIHEISTHLPFSDNVFNWGMFGTYLLEIFTHIYLLCT